MGRALQAYDTATIDRGLLMLAVCAGDSAQAHRRLAADGVHVPERTLRDWKTHVTLSASRRCSAATAPSWRTSSSTEPWSAALLAARLEHAALERATEQMLDPDHEVRDPATVARNAAVTKGINVDQVLKLSGRPTVIAEHRNADDLLDSLAKKLGLTFEAEPVDVTVVEAPSGPALAA